VRVLLLALLGAGCGEASQAESRPSAAPASKPTGALRECLRRAKEAYPREDFPGAEPARKEAFALAPETPEVHRMLGALYLRVRQFQDCARSFERYLALDPSAVGSCPWIGNAYHELGDLEKAEAWYRKVLAGRPDRLDPEKLEAKRGLALTLHKKGDDAAAEPLFREVAKRSKPGEPALADARRYLERISLLWDDALSRLKRFVEPL